MNRSRAPLVKKFARPRRTLVYPLGGLRFFAVQFVSDADSFGLMDGLHVESERVLRSTPERLRLAAEALSPHRQCRVAFAWQIVAREVVPANVTLLTDASGNALFSSEQRPECPGQ